MSRPTPATYKTRNWPAYNQALKRRGSLTFHWPAGDCVQSPLGWFDPAMIWAAAPTGKRGRQPDYSDAAVQTCLTMKVLFGMALRQTTGFVESLLRLMGLDWAVPDFSTLSRRQKTLKVNIPYGANCPDYPGMRLMCQTFMLPDTESGRESGKNASQIIALAGTSPSRSFAL